MSPLETIIGNDGLSSWTNEFVLSIGIDTPSHIPADKQIHVPDLSDENLQRLSTIPPEAMQGGLLFHFPEDTSGLDMNRARQLQLSLIYTWVKQAHHSSQSSCTTSEFGAPPDPVPEVVRFTANMHNIPYILKHPVADKLARLNIGLPVLLLLPGPSLRALEPTIKELARRVVVVCISKSLAWCLSQGVEPDFVVQLDTYLEQQPLYDNIPTLPNTLLIPLSSAPIQRYGHKFRGAFFIDSFNTEINPNPFQLRKSFLSSLMACLGLAEGLHAPDCYVAGADLSSPSKNGTYVNEVEDEEDVLFDPARPIHLKRHRVYLPDRNGHAVNSVTHYVATALEASNYARDIARTTGTRFHTLTPKGLLDAELFPKADIQPLLTAPKLDRKALLSRLDNALATPEAHRLPKLETALVKQQQRLCDSLFHLEAMRHSGDTDQVGQHGLYRFAQRERDIQIPSGRSNHLDFAITIGRRWQEATRQALCWTRAHLLLKQGRKVTMLCEPGEQGDMARRFAPLLPAEAMRFMHIVPGNESAGPNIAFRKLTQSLLDMEVVFVSQVLFEKYDYFFETYIGENLIFHQPLYRKTSS